jgi:hypothetical protein
MCIGGPSRPGVAVRNAVLRIYRWLARQDASTLMRREFSRMGDLIRAANIRE